MDNEKPIRVLQVVGGMNRAGTETMLMNIYRNIDRRKVQFDFISYYRDEAHYDSEIRELGGRVIQLTKTNSISELVRTMKEFGPYDVVHAHTLYHSGIAFLAAFLAGVKVRIAHAHTTLDDENGLVRKLYISFMRYVIRMFSTNLLACSEEAGRYLFGRKGISGGDYSFFPNVIDYKQFLDEPTSQLNTFKLEEGLGKRVVIGHIGRFIDAKNHRFLLEIMNCLLAKDPSMKLLLVGDGDNKSFIEKQVKQLGFEENVSFVGIRDDIPTMIHAMDVFVFPSTYEGLGMVLLEAQAGGIPCVVSQAIQPEADLGIGLMTKLSLEEGTEVWASKILEQIGKKERNKQKIIRGFERKGYTLQGALSRLMYLYKTNNGDEHEKYANRLL
ncbi:glycosyltransferase family 1 protein [Ornithinibacillus californiensis]|uniref:glycosyltransferase family 1 protein n=1 Tax=Ornithinibacillus californiensis TaxID=161536 RepID=UPI00064DD020|nr:glycosyltransferase family 1 protein [Ornithinibacillus californiensis]